MRFFPTAFLCVCAAVGSGCGVSPGASCAEGFQEQDRRCERIDGVGGAGGTPVCNEPCVAAHEVCGFSEGAAICKCAPGYMSQSGQLCAWGGAPLDPEFENDQIWSTTNGATVLPFAMGLDLGVASLASSVVCSGGRLSQTFDMPDYDTAEPLVAEVVYRARDVEGVDIGFDRAFRTLLRTERDDWETARFCLGEAAYGGSIEFQVAASERLGPCFSDPVGSIEVDRFHVAVASQGECPVPGTALNGAADVDAGGWIFEAQSSPVGGATDAGFKDAMGNKGTSGAWLFKEAAATSAAAMSTSVSVPLPRTAGSPALRFWWKASGGSVFPSAIGSYGGPSVWSRALETLVGDGSAKTFTYCLPPWTHGNVIDLTFLATAPNAVAVSELVVDDVEVVFDSGCGTDTELLDPGFNSAPNRWPGVFEVEVDPEGESVAIRDDPTLARPGNGSGVLEIGYSTNKDSLTFETWVMVPTSEGNNGPQLVFYSNVPADPQMPAKWLLGKAAVTTADLSPGGGWRRNEVCLPPLWTGRWFRFRVRVGPELGPLVEINPPKHVYLDDFELGTSAACPAE
jgi:hypothetical protein